LKAIVNQVKKKNNKDADNLSMDEHKTDISDIKFKIADIEQEFRVLNSNPVDKTTNLEKSKQDLKILSFASVY